MQTKKIKMGMIGGGKGAFIGAIHRNAANLDGLIELKAGAFSSNPLNAKESGLSLGLDPSRTYTNYKEMLTKEAKLPSNERIDFVSIVTPNYLHFEPAMLALDNGFHVLVDKPMVISLDEAKQLKNKVEQTGLKLCVSYVYSGYPMVKQAKQMVQNGDLGKIKKIWVEYPQDWLSLPIENDKNKQAAWRTDPAKSGKGGCIGDIGTHAAHLAEYISGLKISHICADLKSNVQGRLLDDDAHLLLQFNNGANGVLMASQVAVGEVNELKIRVFGEKGSIEWLQTSPNKLMVKWLNSPAQTYLAGTNFDFQYPAMTDHCRTPGGHPEGYLEAFANMYRNFSLDILSDKNNTNKIKHYDYPDVNQGLRGMAFIENVIASSQSNEKWTAFKI